MPTEIAHFIDGRARPGRSGRTAPVYNPATGEQSGTVPLANEAEIAEAVALAKQAFLFGAIRLGCG
jgi:malonate-semialdehyde dehydrogenase (acetylating) / methylmalonate-semialdehyde dehydrogenase